jgi:tetratricopeptide (TPR) repeat protein
MYAGQCNQMLGQYEEALSHYNYAIAKNNEHGEIYFHRGLAFVSLTNFDKGIEDFQQALKWTG